MNRLLAIAAIVIAIGAATYVAWTWAYPTGTLRYRMTVEVEVNGEIRTGSSVLEARFTLPPPSPVGGNRVTTRMRGDAAVVDLGDRGLLFVLLTGRPTESSRGFYSDPEAIAVSAFFGTSIGSLPEHTIREMSQMTLKAELGPQLLPMMVRFGDIDDPKTVEWVRPGEFADHYGLGARFIRATLETTDDPVTTGIRQLLPWLEGFKGTFGGLGRPSQTEPEKNLTGNEFIKGRP